MIGATLEEIPAGTSADSTPIPGHISVEVNITLSDDNKTLIPSVNDASVLKDDSDKPKALALQEAKLYISENGPPTKDKPIYLHKADPKVGGDKLNAMRYFAIQELCKNMKHFDPKSIVVQDENARKLIQKNKDNSPYLDMVDGSQMATSIMNVAKTDPGSSGHKQDREPQGKAKSNIGGVTKMFENAFRETKSKYSTLREEAEQKAQQAESDVKEDDSLKSRVP